MARTPAKKSTAKKKTPTKKSAAKPKRSAKTASASKKRVAKKTTKKKITKSTKPKTAAAKVKVTKAKAPKAKSSKATPSKATKAKSKAKPADKKASRSSEEITLDRRGDAQRRDDEPKALEPVIVNGTTLERREKVNRRRQIDPTTCERDYSEAEVEFMNAMDEYKRKNGRMFPTCSEVLEVIRGLGYAQLNPAELAARKANEVPVEGDLDLQVEAEANEALELSNEFRTEISNEASQETFEEAELVD